MRTASTATPPTARARRTRGGPRRATPTREGREWPRLLRFEIPRPEHLQSYLLVIPVDGRDVTMLCRWWGQESHPADQCPGGCCKITMLDRTTVCYARETGSPDGGTLAEPGRRDR
jgi:hypothetical protein